MGAGRLSCKFRRIFDYLINSIVNRSNFLNKTLLSSDETRRMIKDSHFERKLYSCSHLVKATFLV